MIAFSRCAIVYEINEEEDLTELIDWAKSVSESKRHKQK